MLCFLSFWFDRADKRKAVESGSVGFVSDQLIGDKAYCLSGVNLHGTVHTCKRSSVGLDRYPLEKLRIPAAKLSSH